MARSNKYSSINFNDIYEKKISSSTSTKNHSSKPASSSSHYSSATSPHNALTNSPYKAHLTQGRMLVLTRPTPTLTPKPINARPPPQPTPSPLPAQNCSEPELDPISLRPLGRTGTGSALPSPVPVLDRDKKALFAVMSPKPDKFVPPHLRPGFAGREERPALGVRGEPVPRQQGYHGSPGRYAEDGRPKSGGYEGMKRGGQADLNRTSSFGNRPSSSG